MKLSLKMIASGVASLVLLTASLSAATGMQTGNPGLKSIGPLAFGPDGVLFAADTLSATIVALDTGDTTAGSETAKLEVEGIDQKVAALLGTSSDQILINDLAVNPISRNTYLSVSRGRSADAIPVLVRIDLQGGLEVVSLDAIPFSRVSLPNAPADRPVAAGARGSNPRLESITDLAYMDGQVLIAGLSNEEFSSTFRSVNYPFSSVDSGTSVEIYHGSHGRFETNAPIRTFVPFSLDGESRLLAAYTCTPLVEFASNELTPGARVRGKTIAELGNGNRPLDMIVYRKDGKDFLLLANNSRGVMKIGIDNLSATESITSQIPDTRHESLSVDTLADWTGIEQLDSAGSTYAMVMERTASGSLNLATRTLP